MFWDTVTVTANATVTDHDGNSFQIKFKSQVYMDTLRNI